MRIKDKFRGERGLRVVKGMSVSKIANQNSDPTMSRDSFRKALVISLGGAPAPIVVSLNQQKPDYICFFVSEKSLDSIQKDVLPLLNFKYLHHDWIVTPSAENLSQCYRVVREKLPPILEKWNVHPEEVTVDYTGGTKTMSAALVLATIENSCSYTYVGGLERTKQGLGIVVNGKERMLHLDNPWEELAVKERKEASLLFNKARYTAAAEVFSRIARKVKHDRDFLLAMRDMAEGYELWDRFKHKKAKVKLYKVKGIISAYASGSGKSEIVSLSKRINDNLRFLEELLRQPGEANVLFCYDLIANARRRAFLENKYDDAVARLYRVIEAMAQFRLASRYKIRTSEVDICLIPGRLRIEYEKKYLDERTGKLKLSLYASYNLLKELGDDLGKRFFDVYDSGLRSVLKLRNDSILAHGFTSVKQSTYEKMYGHVLSFADIKENKLPEFPMIML